MTVLKRYGIFYKKDIVSRVVPHKIAVFLIKRNGRKERVCVRILEKSLHYFYSLFCQEYASVLKIIQQKFETLRTKNTKLRSTAKRLVCCIIHKNIDYLRQASIRYSKINNLNFHILKTKMVLVVLLSCL